MESIGRHENYSIPPGYPDLEFTKQKVPIQDVARQLGLKVSGRYRAHCWRFDNHRNGDRDPSIRFHGKTNKWRCFVCDERAQSNLDLVMMVLGYDFPAAVAWLCERFPVPAARPGKHIAERRQWNPTYRVGTNGSPFEWLVRAGLWADLPASHRSILVVLDTYTDAETGQAMISYRGLMRYSGVRTKTTVRRALQHFLRIGLLEIEHGVGSDGFRSVSRYRLTFDSTKFLGLVNEIHRRQRVEIELDRAFRAEERKRLRRKALTLPVKELPLSTQCTRGNSHGTPRVDREV